LECVNRVVGTISQIFTFYYRARGMCLLVFGSFDQGTVSDSFLLISQTITTRSHDSNLDFSNW